MKNVDEIDTWKFDVIGVVVAGVVDEAVDGVDDHAGDPLVAVGLHLHSVGSQDPDHPLNITLEKRLIHF